MREYQKIVRGQRAGDAPFALGETFDEGRRTRDEDEKLSVACAAFADCSKAACAAEDREEASVLLGGLSCILTRERLRLDL